MKYRYLKVTGGELIWGKDVISRDDLVQAKQKIIDVLIDTQEGTFYNPQDNIWESIPGD